MSKHSLPAVEAVRSEFGFSRTQCDCGDCTRCCHYIPGYLVPADLERLHRHLAPDRDLRAWAKAHLLASPGALVKHRGRTFRILTLVPARRPNGACLFLTETEKCAIHAVSPFGCAFFDAHMAKAEADHRSKRGLQAVLQAWEARDLYAQVWVTLAGNGLVAPPPEVARQELRKSSRATLSAFRGASHDP
jgi:Fe-S-cluster containining protein